MKKVRALPRYSIQWKLYGFFLLLTIVPILLLGAFSGNILTNILIAQNAVVTEQYLERATQAIDKTLGELESIQISGSWDKKLINALSDSAPDMSQEERTEQITESLRNISNTQKDIAALLLTDRGGNMYSYSLYLTAAEMMDIQKKLESSVENQEDFQKGKILWCSIPGNDTYIAGIRKLLDAVTLEAYGTSILMLDPNILQSQFDMLKTTPNSFFAVYDHNHQVVFSNCVWDIPLEYDMLIASEAHADQVSTGQGQLYRSGRTLSRLGWTIAFFTPVHELMRNVYSMQLLLAGMIFLIISILALLMRRFADVLVKPIQNLSDCMREVRRENFRIHADENRQDEFGQLAHSFNKMADKLNFLIEEDLRSKILLQETEYKFLCAQINPHFLYNTLDSMSWLAATEGNQTVSDMAVALGRMMRWAISNKETLVPLQREVDNVKDYLTIQKMRYGPDFSIHMEIEPETEHIMIPKMTLQPLVENALIHGLELKDGEKILSIRSQLQGDKLYICISDNGIGMQAGVAQDLLTQTQEEKDGHTGIGIGNVFRRIQTISRQNGEMGIESKIGTGTTVWLKMPADMGKEWSNGPGNRGG